MRTPRRVIAFLKGRAPPGQAPGRALSLRSLLTSYMLLFQVSRYIIHIPPTFL